MAVTAPPAAHRHVPSATVRVGGAELAPELMATLGDVRVKDVLMLPSSAVLRFASPQGAPFPQEALPLGAPLQVELGAIAQPAPSPLFDGEIVAIEPDFEARGTTWTVRAYDRGHRLVRGQRTRVFQSQTAGEVANRIGSEHGLAVEHGDLDVAHEYLMQAEESDWQFLWRLALVHDCALRVVGRTLRLRPWGEGAEAAPELERGAALRSFRPRRSTASQAHEVRLRAWDAEAKRELAAVATRPASPARDAHDVEPAVLTSAPVGSAGEGRARARSMMARIEGGALEADGVAQGDPRLRAGRTVAIRGCAPGWDGTYLLSSAEHLYRASGYETRFAITGRAPRTLLDLVAPKAPPQLGRHLVIGLVTNTRDPAEQGRIRVRYPTLDDRAESNWARVAVLGAGRERGVAMAPQVDDEVIVGFEQGDLRRPFVLGTLWNGRDRPHAEHATSGGDGDFVARSDAKVVTRSAGDTELHVGRTLLVAFEDDRATVRMRDAGGRSVSAEVDRDLVLSTGGELTAKGATAVVIEGGTSVTVKGSASVTVESSGTLALKGATVDITGTAAVNISGAVVRLG